MDISINDKSLNLNRKHTSYSVNQLKAILFAGKYINLRKRRIFKSSVLHLFWRLYLNSIRYSTLFLAKITPNSFFDKKPLIDKNELEKIKAATENDWKKCVAYSESNLEVQLKKQS